MESVTGEAQEGVNGVGGGLASKMINLTECLQDSPSFRVQLSSHEQDISDLESKLEKVVSTCDRMVQSGQTFVDSSWSFTGSLRELASHFKDQEIVSGTLKKFCEALSELQSYYSILFDQAQRSVQTALRSSLFVELQKVRDTKKTFHKTSDDLDSATNRNAHVPKSKPLEADEASHQLASVRAQFSHVTIDYGFQINTVACVKGYEILDKLLSFMRAQFTFFHQGYDLLKEFDPFMRRVASEVDQLRKEGEVGVKSMDNRHQLVSIQHLQDGFPDAPLSPTDSTLSIEMSGYLFKRGSNAFKSWSRRWFVLKSNRLVYLSASKADDAVVVAEDLRICSVKYVEDIERRFCFEVVTPSRSCMVQADSEALRKKWVAYVGAGIARALRISASNKQKGEALEIRKRAGSYGSLSPVEGEERRHSSMRSRTDTLVSLSSSYSFGVDFLDVPGNDQCADCQAANPKWASINIGILLCIECSGIHRSLGVHISKVRSVTLDDWEAEAQKIMCALGNTRVNGIYEYDIPEHVRKPTPSSSRTEREAYIQAKYVQHAFVHPHPNFERPEIPLPAPKLSQLLNPGKNSPQRRFSPSLKLRSPKLRMPRPFSQAISSGMASDFSRDSLGSVDSLTDDDRFSKSTGGLGTEPAGGDKTSSTMQQLADNLKKLEKSGKLRSWNLSAKIKTPKRSSFSLGRFSRSQTSIHKRRDLVASVTTGSISHSEDEDEDSPAASSTPLLAASRRSQTPPPKPPRTFQQKRIAARGEHEDNLQALPRSASDDFSSTVLSAIKEMGVVYSQGEGGGVEVEEKLSSSDGLIPNGRLRVASISQSQSSPDIAAILEDAEPTKSVPTQTAFVVEERTPPEKVPAAERETECNGGPPTVEAKTSDLEGGCNGDTLTAGEAVSICLTTSSPSGELDGDEASKEVELDGDEASKKAERLDLLEDNATPTHVRPMLSLEIEDTPHDTEDTPIILRRPLRADSLAVPDSSDSDDRRFSMLSCTSSEWFSFDSSSSSNSEHQSLSPNIPDLPRPDAASTASPDNVPLSSSSATTDSFITPPSSPYPPTVIGTSAVEGTSQCGTERSEGKEEEGEGKRGEEGGEGEEREEEGGEGKEEEERERGEEGEKRAEEGEEGWMKEERIESVKDEDEAVITMKFGSISECAATPSQINPSPPTSAKDGADQQEMVAATKDIPPLDSELAQLSPKRARALTAEEIAHVDAEDLDDVFPPRPASFRETPRSLSDSPGKRRKRSLTVTTVPSLLAEQMEARDKVGDLYPLLSRDDNFETEFQRHLSSTSASGSVAGDTGMVASFSAQDFADIFGARLPSVTVQPPETQTLDDSAIGDPSDMDQSGASPIDGSIEGLNDADCSSVGEELEGSKEEVKEERSEPSSPVNLEPLIIPESEHPDTYLYQCAASGNLLGVLCALAHAGNINFVNEEDLSRCPILLAIDKGNGTMLEFLYQNGGKLNAIDGDGSGSLHYAVRREDAGIIVLLLKRGAKANIKDKDGNTALQIAYNNENGHIVTLLKVAKLKDDHRQNSRQSLAVEDSISEVYKDFEVAAIMEPERMKRRSGAYSSDSASIASNHS